MTEKKRICILSFSTIAWDSRVLREVETARRLYAVDVIAYGEWLPPEGVRYYRQNKTKRSLLRSIAYVLFLLAGRVFKSAYEHAFWMHGEYSSAREILLREKYHLIHANDWNSLPVSVAVASVTNIRILFDAHEYSLTEEADNLLWKFLMVPYREYLYQKYQIPSGAMITVAEGIKDLYQERFGWNMDIILNAPAYMKNEYRPASPQKIRMVHHGAAQENRRLEDFISLVSMLDERYELCFYLLPSQPKYLDNLVELAKKIAPDRVTFLNPVPPKDLVRQLSEFDLGIPLLSAVQSTYVNALPNKFFDFIMSGLAIAVSPLPMMQKIVVEHNIGVVSEDQTPQSMARVLNALSTDEINHYKLNSLKLAKSLNAETEGGKLLNIYQRILESR
jgi:glycosyltransferase involved in cell wall biosynthesis